MNQAAIDSHDQISNNHVFNKDGAEKQTADIPAQEEKKNDDLKNEDKDCIDEETSETEMLDKLGGFKGTLSRCSTGAKSYEDIKKLAAKSKEVVKSETDLTKTLLIHNSTQSQLFYQNTNNEQKHNDGNKTKLVVDNEGSKLPKEKPLHE